MKKISSDMAHKSRFEGPALEISNSGFKANPDLPKRQGNVVARTRPWTKISKNIAAALEAAGAPIVSSGRTDGDLPSAFRQWDKKDENKAGIKREEDDAGDEKKRRKDGDGGGNGGGATNSGPCGPVAPTIDLSRLLEGTHRDVTIASLVLVDADFELSRYNNFMALRYDLWGIRQQLQDALSTLLTQLYPFMAGIFNTFSANYEIGRRPQTTLSSWLKLVTEAMEDAIKLARTITTMAQTSTFLEPINFPFTVFKNQLEALISYRIQLYAGALGNKDHLGLEDLLAIEQSFTNQNPNCVSIPSSQ